MSEIVETTIHRGGDLFEVAVAEPRTPRGGTEAMPGLFNLEFKYNGRDAAALAGGGIYAVYFRGELLYIGIFTGNAKVAFASDVASKRFYKHLEALTLRGRTIGFTKSNYDKVIGIDRPDCPLIVTLRSTTVPRGNGAVKTYPCKVEFASANWDSFSRVEHDRAVLDDFTFVYGRLAPAHYVPGVTYQQVKNYLSVIEDDLLLSHRPRCNEKFTRSDERNLSVGPGREAWKTFTAIVEDNIGRAH